MEFCYRVRRQDKVAKRVRLTVQKESPTEVDNVIRTWLYEKQKQTLNRGKLVMMPIETLFCREIDHSVREVSYLQFRNSQKKNKRKLFGRIGGSDKPSVPPKLQCTMVSSAASPSVSCNALKRARYAEEKRQQRAQAKIDEDHMVSANLI